MTYQDFIACKRQWIVEWKEKWGPMDIDFETFIIMKGVTKIQYDELNNYKPDVPSASHDDFDMFHPHEGF